MFIHDAIDYMTTESDLRQAIDTAFVHCRPGGIAVFVPDHTSETFESESDIGGQRRARWARSALPRLVVGSEC